MLRNLIVDMTTMAQKSRLQLPSDLWGFYIFIKESGFYLLCYSDTYRKKTQKHLKWGPRAGIGLEVIFKCCRTTLVCGCRKNCLGSSTEALQFHLPIFQDPIYKPFHGSHVSKSHQQQDSKQSWLLKLLKPCC